ncbi:endonuclease/exonuclease/phosphatase family protein [Ekhidna sp. To15]|uniref:endonuclease/exonuclease/phosphatase family protein n=1 Tax=Ekhidna sp. To15 TaxID=3395267 RepID=UPI003F52049E
MKSPISILLVYSCLFTACSTDDPDFILDETEDGEELIVVGPCGDKDYDIGTLLCTPTLSNEELEVVTWNIERFPLDDETSNKVAAIISDLDADIYALQEISDVDAFTSLVNAIEGYEGMVVDVRGSIELAFIYKNSAITSISSPMLLFSGETTPFPREPVELDITHSNGLTVKLINIHLKCCDGSENRRTAASNRLKDYIEDNHSDEDVIILGDWNEDFDKGSSFSNFILDSQNFAFVDLPIYQGDGENYSYPCTGASYCPSHIDHILITDELCDNLTATYTVRLDDCVSNYLTEVSDHRPVMVSLKADD